ncbi:hypothetical protein [Streptomyces aureus]|uniref:hypothetical protein n=1 Tax=Streptomyces aureus TaxID=193461 RepID=UPI00362B4F05
MPLIPEPSLAVATTVRDWAALTPTFTVVLLNVTDVKVVSPLWLSACAAGARTVSSARVPPAAVAAVRIRMVLQA